MTSIGNTMAVRYLPRDHTLPSAQPTTEVSIPSDSYFVAGDNSAVANDSRFWGSVSGSSIVGRVTNKSDRPVTLACPRVGC